MSPFIELHTLGGRQSIWSSEIVLVFCVNISYVRIVCTHNLVLFCSLSFEASNLQRGQYHCVNNEHVQPFWSAFCVDWPALIVQNCVQPHGCSVYGECPALQRFVN